MSLIQAAQIESLNQRNGVLVRPECRLSEEQIKLIDGVSRDLLEDPGLLCYNAGAAKLFEKAGARSEQAGSCVRLRVPPLEIHPHSQHVAARGIELALVVVAVPMVARSTSDGPDALALQALHLSTPVSRVDPRGQHSASQGALRQDREPVVSRIPARS